MKEAINNIIQKTKLTYNKYRLIGVDSLGIKWEMIADPIGENARISTIYPLYTK